MRGFVCTISASVAVELAVVLDPQVPRREPFVQHEIGPLERRGNRLEELGLRREMDGKQLSVAATKGEGL